MMLEEENFRKGVMVEDLAGENGQQNGNEGDEGDDASEKQSLTSEEQPGESVDKVIARRKHGVKLTGSGIKGFAFKQHLADRSSTSEDAQLGTFALSLPGKRPFPAEPDSLSVLPKVEQPGESVDKVIAYRIQRK
jgi:hypothetical protein